MREESGARREIHGLRIKGHYLHIEEWDVRWRDYQISNSTSKPLDVLGEHLRTRQYDLVDTPQPQEHTDEHLRFPVVVPAHDETTLGAQERRLFRRR